MKACFLLSVALLPALAGLTGCAGASSPTGPAPVITAFSASTASIHREESVVLTADFLYGSGTVSPGFLPISSGRPLILWPIATTTYTLTVEGNGRTATRQVQVQVQPAVNPWNPTRLPDPDPARMQADVDHLADPALAGRLTGQPGCVQAATYIAQEMHAMGLATMGGNGETAFHFTYAIPSRGIQSSNIVGLVPGLDPVLRSEYVVFTAHYDHIETRNGVVVPGADDNASGTAGILEAARLLVASRPARSLVFLAVSGEEMGLLGSEAFLSAPPIPSGSIVADLNLDMIGRGAPGQYHVLPAALPDRVTTLVKEARWAAAYHAIQLSAGMDQYFTQSDHYSFAKRGIPTLFLHDGEAVDYHNPADTRDKIDYGKMAGMVKVARDVGFATANAPSRPAVVTPAEFASWAWGPFPGTSLRRWEGFLPPGPSFAYSPASLPALLSRVSAPPTGR